MRILSFIALLACSATLVSAGDTSGTGSGKGHHGGKHHQRLLDQFDANHDGKLDDAEKAAARGALSARLKGNHPDLFAKLDADHDGQLSKDEMKAGRDQVRALKEGHKKGSDGRKSKVDSDSTSGAN